MGKYVGFLQRKGRDCPFYRKLLIRGTLWGEKALVTPHFCCVLVSVEALCTANMAKCGPQIDTVA